MSWLAKLEIDAEIICAQGISNDIYSWHQKLWECYPDDPDAKRDFLTRIDPMERSFRLWVLAKRKPVCPSWCPPDCFAAREIAPSFFNYRQYAFDLRANPVKTHVQRGPDGEILIKPNGKRKSGKRVPIVEPDELRQWLINKGKVRCLEEQTHAEVPGGFCIIESKERPLEISPMVESHFWKENHRAYHGGVQFRGILEVTDRAHFIETHRCGIGSAKGFGFGLLLLAPIKQ